MIGVDLCLSVAGTLLRAALGAAIGRSAEVVAAGGAETELEMLGAATMTQPDEPAGGCDGEDGGGEGVGELNLP